MLAAALFLSLTHVGLSAALILLFVGTLNYCMWGSEVHLDGLT